MSDTVLFNRVKISGAFKSIMVYLAIAVIISGCTALGQAFLDMEEEKWRSMWWMKRTGWWLLLIGNVLGNGLNTFKAATSNSTRKTDIAQ